MDATEIQLCRQMAATASNNFQANNFQANNLQANNLSLLNALANGRGPGFPEQSVHAMVTDPADADLLLNQRNAAMNGNFMTLGEISSVHPSQLEMSLMRSQIGISNNQAFLQNTNQMDAMPRSVDSDTSARNRYKYYGRSSLQQMDTASIVENLMNRRQSTPGTYHQHGRLNQNFQREMHMNSFISQQADEAAQLREMYMAEQLQKKQQEMLLSPQSSLGSLHETQSVQGHIQERIRIRSRRGPQQRVHHPHFNERSSTGGIDTISNFSSNAGSDVDLSNFQWMKNNDHQGSDMMCD